MNILSIETSCDETALALVEAKGGLKTLKFRILKNIVSSQAALHAHWGGVVPSLAKREHLKNLPLLFRQILNNRVRISNFETNSKFKILALPAGRQNSKFKIDAIAVTVGPGLEPALWTGVNFAKEIHQQFKTQNPKFKIPLIGVNHLEGHLYSFLLAPKKANSKPQIRNSKIFPAVSLLVSGGHTILVLMKSLTEWKKLGETRDDAVGEAFDKVARLLKLPYPGGPEIERLAAKGNSSAVQFPRPMVIQKNYDFSFSGLKTAVLYYLRDLLSKNNNLSTNLRLYGPARNPSFADIAASFQKAAFDVLVAKTIRAAKEFKAKSIMLSGGVAANRYLRKMLRQACLKLKTNFFVAPAKFQTDNAVIIAVAGYIQYLQGRRRTIRAQANLNL